MSSGLTLSSAVDPAGRARQPGHARQPRHAAPQRTGVLGGGGHGDLSGLDSLSLQFGVVLHCGLGTSSESHKFDHRTLRNVPRG